MIPPKQTKRTTGTVGEGEVDKKVKVTQHVFRPWDPITNLLTRFRTHDYRISEELGRTVQNQNVILRMIMGSIWMGLGTQVMGDLTVQTETGSQFLLYNRNSEEDTVQGDIGPSGFDTFQSGYRLVG